MPGGHDIPDLDGAISCSKGDTRAIGRPRYSGDSPGRALIEEEPFAAACQPDLQAAILADRCYARAIGRPGDIQHSFDMAAIDLQDSAGAGIPNAHRRVTPASRQQFAIGGPCHARNCPDMAPIDHIWMLDELYIFKRRGIGAVLRSKRGKCRKRTMYADTTEYNKPGEKRQESQE